MKQIQAIIRRERLGEVMEALEEVHCRGIMAWAVEGHGKQRGFHQTHQGHSLTMKWVPKIKLEIVVQDTEVDAVVDAITVSAATGEIGDGKIFIVPIESAIRIRTKEAGEAALL